VVRLRLSDVLEEKGWTAWRLAKETGGALTVRGAYRLADPEHQHRRLDLGTLSVLCRALGMTPGELLEYVPDKRVRGKPR
jgi:DNA-binding Xre family transcriptional regulator